MTLFAPPPIEAGHITPRPYQQEALDALDEHIQNREDNPCVAIPTGGGKSVLMAWMIQRWKADYPPFRCIILAHRKELVQQNSEELIGLWPAGDIGIYSSGLGRRDIDHSILFAGIDSVAKRWGEFSPWDCIIVDEAHRIPAKGEGKYRDFIKGCKLLSPHLRVVGFTATPFRMGCGPICHKDHILHKVAYEANVGDLIRDGYLCRLRSKVGDVQPDLENVRKNSGGDYITSSLHEAVERGDIVAQAVRSAMQHIARERRQSVVWFCVDVDHCRKVSNELRKYGVEAPVVTAKTPAGERDRIARSFIRGHYKAICNVNVYTEGFNAKRVDCIVLLRPTLSKGLYVQMVGRGLRLHPDKIDCIVLDYAGCIGEHGPIDCIDEGEVKLIDCQSCGDTFSMAIRQCPHCGWNIPKREIERAEAEERQKKMHAIEASKHNILNEPDLVDVDAVTVHRHRKPGKPDSIRVEYRSGLTVFREWICLDHDGFAGTKAQKWWAERFGKEEAESMNTDNALADMFLGDRIRDVTKSIVVIRKGKHFEIVQHRLKESAA